MPGTYEKGKFDIAGFAVGAFERGHHLPRSINKGDLILGLPSSGIHSNGFSLVRKIVEISGLNLQSPCPFSEKTLGTELLTPTEIYVKSCLEAVKTGHVVALAHITGGGLIENITRSIPNNLSITIDLSKIKPKKIFKWLKSKNIRDKIIIADKIVGRSNMNWFRDKSEPTRLNPKQIKFALERSLKNLNTDYIDLYQLHWPERKVPRFGELDYKYDPNDNTWTSIEEVLYNLNELVKSGKIRYVGLSNETPWGMMKFLEVAKEKNFPRMMSIQNAYSLVNRVYDIGHSEVSMAENLGLLAYSPLAGGRLSGKYIGGINPKNARYTLWPRRFSRHHTERGEIAIEKYVDIANTSQRSGELKLTQRDPNWLGSGNTQ